MVSYSWFLLLVILPSSYAVLYSCNPSAVCGCSSNSASVNRIVGGENAGSLTWNWAVSISADGSLCGGSIISPLWVMTAAHCLDDRTRLQLIVYAGSNGRFAGSQIRTVSQMVIHPRYDRNTFLNDIALLRLSSPLNLNDPAVGQICLPDINPAVLTRGEWPSPNTPVVAVGWGTLFYAGPLPQSLQQVTLGTVDYRASVCNGIINDPRVQLCATVPGGAKDTCQGDSGGPLMMFTANNQWVLVGLTSFGEDCARPSVGGAYTRVAFFKDWIRNYATDSNWLTLSSSSTNSQSSLSAHLSPLYLLMLVCTIWH